MPTPIAVVFADSHLQERAWARRPIVGDSYLSLRQIISYAIKHEIKHVIGAGDLIDKHVNESYPVVKFDEQLHRLHQHDGVLWYIQGQHEMSEPPWLSGHPAAVHIHERKMNLHGLDVVGLDYQPAGLLQPALDRVGDMKPDVLIAHQVWGEFMGSIAHPQGGFHDVPVARLMFTGDYHGEYVDKTYKGKSGQDLRVINPGSTCMQSIDEPVSKFFCVLNDDGSVTKIKLKTRQFIDWGVLNTTNDLDSFMSTFDAELNNAYALTDKYPDEVRIPLLRVTYSHRLGDAVSRITRAVGDRAHLFFKELPPANEEAAQRREQRASTGEATTLESRLEGYLNEKDMAGMLVPCQRLLAAADVPGELRRMREEVMTDG